MHYIIFIFNYITLNLITVTFIVLRKNIIVGEMQLKLFPLL